MSQVVIHPVRNSRDLRRFVRLPWQLHRDLQEWVPPLLVDIRNRLNRQRNPFFQHGEAEYFLATRSGRTVGRIAAIENRLHNETHSDRVGFFGWFDCTDDQEVAEALFQAAESWTRERDLDTLRGPVSFSINDECGILVDGFDSPPTIMTAYNPPYYVGLLEGAGFQGTRDLYGFKLPVMHFEADRMKRIVRKVRHRENLEVRRLRMDDFPAEIERLKLIYNDAWSENWGFIPMTNAEIDHMARDLKPIICSDLAAFVEIDGEPVGFSLVLPNLNEILARMNGRLLPFGFLRILLGIRRVDTIRLIAMGIRRDWQRRGLDSVLYYESFKAARELGKIWSELGWVLEGNTVMINTIERLGGQRYKTWRLYDRQVPDGDGGNTGLL